MRDRAGNVTAASDPASVSTPTSAAGVASFAYGPVGISSNAITMRATTGTNASGHTEYLFSRSGGSSGWQASPTWTDTGLTPDSTYTYTVQMRDARGHLGAASTAVAAVARDQAAPILPRRYAQWSMLPYATIDNKVSMTAQTPVSSDAAGVQYFFHCTSSNAPDSGWQNSATYVTPSLPDGTYTFEYKVRDKSASNESPASASYSAKITPTTGYHSSTLPQVLTSPDDCLVSFTATVMRVNTNHYFVQDVASGAGITVRPSTSNEVTDVSLALRHVSVKGHLYTFAGTRVVTFATLTAVGNPDTRTVSGKVISTTASPVAGAIVYFSDSPHAAASPIVTATTDASGAYSRAVTPGTWYVTAAASAYHTAAERVVAVSNANVSGVNFLLAANARITGEIVRQSDRNALAGAAVYFSQSPGASGSPLFTATADASGRYSQPVQDGDWYVCASASGHFTSADQRVTVDSSLVTNINFVLRSNARSIPATNRLWFSAVTESLPESGNTGPWAQYLPSGGGAFATIGGNPTVAKIDGAKWVRNYRVGTSTGFRVLGPTAAIPCNGVTIVTAARPSYVNPGGEQRGELVDIMYDRLALAVAHTDGRVMVARNGNWGTYGPALAQDRTTLLSLVVQPDGSYRVYTNGVQAMTGAASTPNFATNLVPTGSQTFKQYVNIGRNEPDGWSAYEGCIGDVFVYTNALADAERQQLEADLSAKFLNPGHAISVSAGAGGYVNPGGIVTLPAGGAQSFAIAPWAGYVITNVTVDGVSCGALTSYTFSNVTASHSLAAFFGPAACRVTLTTPAYGETFLAPASVALEASVTTARPVNRVEFYEGAVKLGEVADPPYTWAWADVAAGVHTLTARAIYDLTNSADASPVSVIVMDPPPPEVAILSPAVTNACVPSGAGLVLEAIASTIRNPPQLTTVWTRTSGPGAVTFGDLNALSTTATFSSPGTYVLTFTASDGALQSSSAVTIGYGVTPAPAWSGIAVGTLAAGAGFTSSGGTLSITAGGAGIQSTAAADDFYFVQQACRGDVQITARVVSIQNVSGSSSRAGVMIRETTARGATEAFMGVSSVNGGRFIWRTTTDSSSANASSTLALPCWVRISRVGNVFTAHTAVDAAGSPGTWTQQGAPQTIAMSSSACLGLAAASGSATANGAVVIDTVTVSPAQGNVGPRVYAGPDQTVSNDTFTVRGAASDDGLPNPPGAVTTQWRQSSGPASVMFDNAAATNSSVTFPAPGAYVLRLVASDGEVTTFDEALITAAFPAAPPQIGGWAVRPAGDGFTFHITNSAVTSYTLLVSSNLTTWSTLVGGLAYSNGVFHILDPLAAGPAQRFYRLQYP